MADSVQVAASPPQKKKKRRARLFDPKRLKKNWELYVLIIPTFLSFLVFSYIPMYGVLIAFKDYVPVLGIWDSPWVGFKYFQQFFSSYYFWDLIRNTIGIQVYGLVVGFPLPIILALALNEMKDGFWKKFSQTVTYAPNFISVVVMGGMIIAFLDPSTGIINHVIQALGIKPIAFMSDPKWFKTVYVLSGVWQGTGWGSVIYLAALAGVDPALHEAAIVDGASRIQRIWHINLPAIVPTMVILLIMNVGSLFSMGYEKILLLQNPLNLSSSNVIATFVYKQGLLDGQYSYAAAVGLFNSAINAILLIIVNKIAQKVSDTSLW
ncbi:sugar ABC transporter permease [Schleiferilactobacillus harbinensis]|jgi:putative aldouronate transport system permease protein|uniref:ABC transporter permease n=1 Tax=Schleiferilactobacillus harbinensis TaxID=304207 RepID=UPI001169BED8|nr:ABC transporter permease subunit [Schleiferilactobacillus harbinensis]MBO3091598.1 sugar ABC transporter permease [Schleiferilactobacillus harbinensis]MCI1686813.1 ABC transporter permease subunit [Schleiferilactobacillus harbinensis]MCI1782688.1 ABC transporter permease subunit [Schleiferilactobacillus harbinensis]MCI1849632.1 ABC transporter permease subunit [Schleiferilactobacillus harbinensis]QEU48386.1 sugar ABC transporter permease [Schleiferilactobacillus harbinensis]